MKRGFILVASLLVLMIASLIGSLSLHILNYKPRQYRDLKAYVQASILSDDIKELSKYLLYLARQKGNCLSQIRLNYPGPKDLISIDYVYPLASCENGHLITQYKDPMQIIMVNSSVRLQDDLDSKDKSFDFAVNESVFLQKSFFIYTNFKDSNISKP